MNEWDHKDEWRKRGENFLVTVTRHTGIPMGFEFGNDEGLNRWAVYAYIYPKHPLFLILKAEHVEGKWSNAARSMPLHWGCSFYEAHKIKGEVKSFQIGADYHHIHDQEFTHMKTKDHATEVFADAENLFEYLSNPQEVGRV